ncbi:MAG TPA: dienelactone hydrolase family protein [Phenylobacterium sp.]|jgi:carboxymethylenebutenolidase|uniref:dienelactone hydrolase family protein n=1 Tax=Phenylobacterium sp. TaxID=1871053 RepID=UPI002B8B583D|nr:dienelactone hydrolase family protein [Phenylobacterium sp.]HXA38076.1 dienelactone hydrolase family protein [Phenylobacterium sp.]
MKTDVSIPTPEGDARAFVFTPDTGSGPWPAAILYMDAPAIRPAMFEMGERLAQAGYYVLLPDVFWRAGPYPPLDIVKARGGDPEQVALFQRLRASTDPARAMADTAAYLDWLTRQPQAIADRVGVTGYCMGGGIALRAAGTFPERIAVAASFHGGGMATDAEDSPHLLAPAMKAKILVAGADQDSSFDEAQCARLDKALNDAGLDAKVTIWTGMKHGWVPADMPVHDAAGAERHWTELVALFDEVLKA